MAATFERCGRATCLGGFDASITGVMAVSPDGDDYEGDAIAQVARQALEAVDRVAAAAQLAQDPAGAGHKMEPQVTRQIRKKYGDNGQWGRHDRLVEDPGKDLPQGQKKQQQDRDGAHGVHRVATPRS